jgi:hypothetical protein
MVACRYAKFNQSKSNVTSGGLGTMGFALPAAIGAKYGAKERTVIAVIGDGGVQMTIQELGTIMQNDINVKILILNNRFLGMVRQWQDLFHEKRYSFVDIASPDYVAVAKGYKVVKLETMVDAAFINNVEMKWEGVQFVRVDADVVDNLIDKQENVDSILSKDEVEQAKKLFEFQVPEITLTVEVKGLSQDAAPIVATRPEFMRRMKDMAGMGGGGMTAFYAQMPDEVHLTVNGNHPIFQTLLKEPDVDKQQMQARNLADLALLSQGLLKGAELTNFINRSVDLLK